LSASKQVIDARRCIRIHKYCCLSAASKIDWCTALCICIHTYGCLSASESDLMQAYVYACTHTAVWALARVPQIDASWCIRIDKCNLHAYTSTMYTHAQRTAVWALARVIDASWCTCIHKVLLFEVIDASWCIYIYVIDASQFARALRCKNVCLLFVLHRAML
jgi:hypothetical protein